MTPSFLKFPIIFVTKSQLYNTCGDVRMRRICGIHQLAKPLQVVVFSLVELQDGFVFRGFDDHIYAFANVCPHRGWEMDLDGDAQFFNEYGMIHCKAHGAQFHPCSGELIAGPKSCKNKRLFNLPLCVKNDDVYLTRVPKTMLDYKVDFGS